MSGYDMNPFTVSPSQGSLEPNETAVIILKFAPLVVADFIQELQCNMPGLAPSLKPFNIRVKGSSLRPLCHFELPESDYILCRRNAMDTPTSSLIDIDPQTRVIEFDSCGVSVRNYKRFYIVNPSDDAYEFEWTCLDPYSPNQVFRCETPKGVVAENKKFEIVFEYCPDSVEVKVINSRTDIR
jgi:hypothetical protein